MATQTPNFNFDLRESADIFNPLSTNANFESLDTILKNLQENGGITTYTTTAAANLLKLSGTPKVNDTVFKFVAAGDANTWTGATGGVVNNIVALDGKQVTIKGGNMYVAWVNSANAMVVIAWPTAVDAQTFAGKGPTEWASKAQLDSVNQIAANATQTAQAAQTVANNANTAAQNGDGPVKTFAMSATNSLSGNGPTLYATKTLYELRSILNLVSGWETKNIINVGSTSIAVLAYFTGNILNLASHYVSGNNTLRGLTFTIHNASLSSSSGLTRGLIYYNETEDRTEIALLTEDSGRLGSGIKPIIYAASIIAEQELI